jgi:putative FmdB family regulatory protein
MPLYNYRCKKCGYEYERLLPMKDMEKPLSEKPEGCAGDGNCEIEQIVTKANFGDPWKMGRIKPNDDFRSRLKEIKKAHPGSTIKDI